MNNLYRNVPVDLINQFNKLDELFKESAEIFGTIEEIKDSISHELNIFHHLNITFYDWKTEKHAKYKDYRFFYKFYIIQEGVYQYAVMCLKMQHIDSELSNYYWFSKEKLGWSEIF